MNHTNRVIRERNVNNALGTLAIEGINPTEDIMELTQKYINGKIETEDMLAAVIAKYKQN